MLYKPSYKAKPANGYSKPVQAPYKTHSITEEIYSKLPQKYSEEHWMVLFHLASDKCINQHLFDQKIYVDIDQLLMHSNCIKNVAHVHIPGLKESTWFPVNTLDTVDFT